MGLSCTWKKGDTGHQPRRVLSFVPLFKMVWIPEGAGTGIGQFREWGQGLPGASLPPAMQASRWGQPDQPGERGRGQSWNGAHVMGTERLRQPLAAIPAPTRQAGPSSAPPDPPGQTRCPASHPHRCLIAWHLPVLAGLGLPLPWQRTWGLEGHGPLSFQPKPCSYSGEPSGILEVQETFA